MLAALAAADAPTRAVWITAPPRAPRRRAGVLAPGISVWWRAEDNGDAPVPIPQIAWHARARCRGMDHELFFGTDDVTDRPSLTPTTLSEARAVCQACPVRRPCLTWALRLPERYGVWGGTSGRDRMKLRLRLGAGATIESLVDECLT